jgi:hypothetical protein
MKMKNIPIKRYSELIQFKSFEERFEYLKISGFVGVETFGFDRIFNQRFYRSREWRQLRDHIILRDNGCDLGVNGFEINGRIIIHHMNPIGLEDIEESSDYLMNPEYLITTTHTTHNAIHFGDSSLLPKNPIERKPNDTCPWRK